MTITRNFKLCLNAGTGSAPFINVSQTDRNETWLFELYTETGERYIPSSGAIIGIKADGHGIANTGTVDSEGRVVIAETEQMTAAAGRSICELSIDGLTHGTANFIVNVEKKPIDGAIMSDSDLSLIQEAVDSAAVIVEVIGDSDPSEVIGEHVDDWLDNHPEATTTVQDGAITEAKLNDSVKTGVFEDMTVGTSLSVWNDEGQTDNLAYKFRQTGADAVRELDEIVGGTIAWNQILNPSSATQTVNGITKTPQEDGISLSGTATARTEINLDASAVPFKADHVYLIAGITGGSATTYAMLTSGSSPYGSAWYNPTLFKPSRASSEHLRAVVYNGATVNILAKPQVIDLTAMFGSIVADAIYAMEQSSAGSGVAYFRSLFPNDYYAYNAGELVSVEGLSAHETTGFNQFDKENARLFYAYLRIENNVVQWAQISDSRSFAIRCLPNTEYAAYIKGDNPTIFRLGAIENENLPSTPTSGNWVIECEKQFASSSNGLVTYTTGTNAKWLIVQISSSIIWAAYNNLCINISSSENGEYKPYKKHTYPLDSTLTLRGVPKWNNGLYFDGDIYRHDGSVQRRYGVVDLGSRTWTYSGSIFRTANVGNALQSNANALSNIFCAKYQTVSMASVAGLSAIGICVNTGSYGEIWVYDSNYTDAASFKTAMSGVYLVYELATPTTEQADPYQQYQICDGKGTEEYISTSVTPVGHNTFYPVDIVSKVNGLPSDFSTLIAPTEEGFKATRNYTAKQFLIINNQLYKVTANIANGATITPNTNVTAVTIADILTTLI